MEQIHEIVSGAAGRDDDSIGPTSRKRNEDAHPERLESGVRLRMNAVDHVVNRDDAPEVSPSRGSTRQAVEQIDARGLRKSRQKLLFSAHPFAAPSPSHRDGDDRNTRPPELTL